MRMSRKWTDGPYKPQKGLTPEKVIKAPFKLAKGIYDKVLEPTALAVPNIGVEEGGRRFLEPFIKKGLNKLPRENFSHNFESMDKPFRLNASIEAQNKNYPDMHVSRPLQADNRFTKVHHETKFRPLNLLKGVSPFVTHSKVKLDTDLTVKRPVMSPQLKEVLRGSIDSGMVSKSLEDENWPWRGKLGYPDPANQQFPRTKIPWSTGEGLDGGHMSDPYEPKPKINTERWNRPSPKIDTERWGQTVASAPSYGKDPKLGLSNYRRVDKQRSLDNL